MGGWWVKIQSSGVMHGERRAERHERDTRETREREREREREGETEDGNE